MSETKRYRIEITQIETRVWEVDAESPEEADDGVADGEYTGDLEPIEVYHTGDPFMTITEVRRART